MKQLISLLLTITTLIATAQNHYNGVVTDIKKRPIFNAKVEVVYKENKAGTGIMTYTNESGAYRIRIPDSISASSGLLISASMIDTTFRSSVLNNDTILVKTDTCYGHIPRSGKSLNKKSYVAKPAIYLYPARQTLVTILHDFKGTLSTTYPTYKNGWRVRASPNGSLLNLDDNRRYEYLFWDGTCNFPPAHFDFKEGFVVAKENIAGFLLEKLAYIGLNEKESNDFIVYWLPQLNQNEYNFIYFRINDDIDHSSVLHVDPVPDTRIRLFMEYKPVDSQYTMKEQHLPRFNRNGFTLVEWGGAVVESPLTQMQ